jgi:hypothetical protein
MKLLPNSKIRRVTLAAASIGVVLLAASAAQAFTFENPGATTGDTNALRFGTADSRFSTNNGNGAASGSQGNSSMRYGNSTLQFGGQSSFDQRYNNDRMFDSNGILGKDR